MLDKNPASQTSAKSESDSSISSRPFGYKQFIISIASLTLAIFITGFILATISAHFSDFKSKPNRGDVLYNTTTKVPVTFRPYYPKLRKFAISDKGWEAGSESQFSRHGTMLTGLFFHIVINAFHWTLEMKFHNLGLMVIIPLFLLFIGNFIFFFKIIPRSKRTQESAVTYSTVLGLSHAFLILIVYISFNFANPGFGALFGAPYLYAGAQMSIMIPSALVIMLTGFTYGAICGGVISGLVFLEKIYHQL